jgi:hypothetical protein
MTRTKIRGAWPGKPQLAEQMRCIKEKYTPPTIYNKGVSAYQPYIEYLMSNRPGEVAIECATAKTADLLRGSLRRYLVRTGGKYRTAMKKESDACVKVWILNK